LRRLVLLAPLALLALATTSPAATRTYTSHLLHAAIPDTGSAVRSIDVPDPGPVSFVAVGVRIAHQRDSDLTLTLSSPRGRKVVLSARRGGTGADYGSGPKGCSGNLAWFESDALDPVSTTSPPFAGEQRPEQPLTVLNGEEARGHWSLRVDDGAAGARGTLLCWQLEVSRNVVEHVRATGGDVSADLSFRETKSYYNDLRITVRRHGLRVLTTPVSRLACHDCSVSGLQTIADPQPLTIRDLDGDGEPEVLLDLYTGGAHCCFYTVILRYDGHRYRGSVGFWGDPGYELRDLDRDGRPEFITADDRFAYAFTSYAGSVLPILIHRYDHGALADVTNEYPSLVRAEATHLWREYLRDHRRRDADVRGLLAGWLADEYRLGRQDEGWRQIEAAYRRGELSAPRVDPIWPAGRKYLTALRAFLVKNGYA
jgi:subtilisin-like proprotein convertase family protein